MAVDLEARHPTPWFVGGDDVNGHGLLDANGQFVLPLPFQCAPEQTRAIETFVRFINGGEPAGPKDRTAGPANARTGV